ncbi:beta transducin [Conglomerata obtusa]
METNGLPEFIYTTTKGDISNKNSKIKKSQEGVIISLDNTINIWNLRTFSVDTIHNSKADKISAFAEYKTGLEIFYALGFENGVIKVYDATNTLVVQYKAHRKRITEIVYHDNNIIASSIDGTLTGYDITTEDVKFYLGSNCAIFSIVIIDDKVFANCKDGIRMWSIEEQQVIDFYAFEEEVLYFLVLNDYFINFYCNGTSEIYNYKNRTKKNFNIFKKLRDVCLNNDRVYILENDKLHVYNIKFLGDLILQNIMSKKLETEVYCFCVKQNKCIFITKFNSVLIYEEVNNSTKTVQPIEIYSEFIEDTNKKISTKENFEINFSKKISYHEKEIFELFLTGDKIISISEEKFVVWKLFEKNLEKLYSINFEFKAHTATLLDKFLVVGSKTHLYQIDIKNGCIINQYKIYNTCLSCFNNYLFVGSATKLIIFEITSKFDIVYENEFEEHIVKIAITCDNQLYAISFLNNNVILYDRRTNDQKLVLYGHSLPVKYMSFSPDSKLIITCGADKLVKLWGTDFGECRKSFIGNAKNSCFINNDAFLFADETIKYYYKHDLVKSYKTFQPQIVAYNKNYLITTTKHGLLVYKVGEYALILKKELYKEESSEVEEILLKETKILNYKKFEEFIEELNKDEIEIDKIFNKIKLLDYSEADKFIYLLNSVQVKTLIDCMDNYVETFPLLIAKLLSVIFKIHGYLCENDEKIYATFVKLLKNVEIARNNVGINLYSLD